MSPDTPGSIAALALVRGLAAMLALALGTLGLARADEVEEITVVGVTPTEGAELELAKIPAHVQAASAADLARLHSLDLSDFMSRALGSVSINSAQGNPLQPDVQFRGFTASPLLGLPQGLAVYQDGARINEPFGDAVNWDLLPQSAVSAITLTGGANPVFGLNTLGGALVIDMKTGFSYQGHQLELSSGSWGRVTADAQGGGNNGTLGYYVDVAHFEEDGWRALSPSRATNFYGSASWQHDHSSLEVGAQYARSDLRGNGPTPLGLLAVDRSAVFTAPDITHNDLSMLTLEGTHAFTPLLSFSSSAFYRGNDTHSFNGDAAGLLACALGDGERLLDGIDDDALAALGLDTAQLCDGSFADAQALQDYLNGLAGDAAFDVKDLSGSLSGTGVLADEAINNRSTRDQRSAGADVQLSFARAFAGHDNLLVLGLGYYEGRTGFDARVELADLDPVTRSTEGLGTGSYLDSAATQVHTDTRSRSAYFTDSLSLTEGLTLTLAGRYDDTRERLRDKSGERPELNGDHDFRRFNPALGFAYQLSPVANLYGSYSESARAPTPIELSCNEGVFELAQRIAVEQGEDPADVDFECRLPNAFLGDPPLDEVVARSVELGVRGRVAATDYHFGVFRTFNDHDIIFQTTGRSTGLFANVDRTRRLGFETSLRGHWHALDWSLAYTFLQATFEDDFQVLSPNHPLADADGRIAVHAGDRMPGIPEHQLKLGGDWLLPGGWSVGTELIYDSDQILRGDESNQLDTLAGYTVCNLRGGYHAGRYDLYARIDNLFDRDYVNFGLLGEDPTQVLPTIADDRPIFVGVGAPRAAWIGLRVSL